jgi:hypothetical protein
MSGRRSNNPDEAEERLPGPARWQTPDARASRNVSGHSRQIRPTRGAGALIRADQ